MIYVFDGTVAKEYGVNEAIMITNLQFWIAKNKASEKHFYDEHWWTYNSKASFEKLFPFWSTQTIKTTLNHLKEKGVIITGNYNKNAYDKTLWYAFADENRWLTESPIKKLPATNRLVNSNQPIPDIIPDNNIPPLNNNNKLLLLSPQGEKWSFAVDFVKRPEDSFAIEDFAKYEYLIPSLRVWLSYKAKRKQKYQNMTQILKLCDKLHNLCTGNPDVAMKIIDESLANNWSGLFALKNQPLASNEDVTAFVKIWNTFVARTTEDIANIRFNYAFTPKVKAVTESDVRNLIPSAKSVLNSLMGSLPQKSGSPAINGWSGYDQSDQWRFATSLLYVRWRNSKFLRDMPVTASMFLKHIDKIADPYNDCYLNK